MILDYTRLIISTLMLSSGIGLLFVALSTPRRTATNYHFAIFAAVLSSFALTLFLRNATGGIPNLSPFLVLRILSILLVLLISSFFSFVVYFLESRQTYIIWMMRGLWGFVIFSIAIIIFSSVFSETNADGTRFQLNIISIVLLIIAILYSIVALLLVWRSDENRARWLRVPSVAITSGYCMTALFPDMPLDIAFFTIGALWAASALTRQHILMPIQTLNQELARKNETLQQTISQLQQEKNHIELLNRKLIESNRHKTEFLSNISHELRTPLNAVIGYSELLSGPIYGQLNKQQNDRLERIYRNGRHLAGLIDNILDIGHIESGKLTLEKSNIDVSEVIANVLARTEETRAEKSLVLERGIQPDLPLIHADSRRVEQIIYNLVDNAGKFTQEGKIHLRVLILNVNDGTAREIDLPAKDWLHDGTWMLFQVSDTGIGIPPHRLEKIFLSFMQADNSPTRMYGGMGLGLAIVKQLVELHEGIVWVESIPDTGSSFYVALPSIVQ